MEETWKYVPKFITLEVNWSVTFYIATCYHKQKLLKRDRLL